MINLLPPKTKENTQYARRNTQLKNWSIALAFSMVGIAGIIIAGQLYLQKSINSYAKQVDLGQAALKAQKLEETQAKVQDLTSGLKLVVQVLSREVLFSKLLAQVGAALPSGSVLTNLSINKVQGGLDLQAATTDYQTATQVQLNLQDPKNKIFEKADIVNIQCASTSTKNTAIEDAKSQYPCTVQLRALFATNNPFLFIPPTITTGAKP